MNGASGRRLKRQNANTSPEGTDAAADTSSAAVWSPQSGEIDPRHVSDSDSLESEAWDADTNPLRKKAWAGLDDPGWASLAFIPSTPISIFSLYPRVARFAPGEPRVPR